MVNIVQNGHGYVQHSQKRHIVDFAGLMEVFYQVARSVLASLSCIESVKIRLDAT